MRILGLLSWYDESPTWLAAYVAALGKFGCSHLIACDGAYMLYPGAIDAPRSQYDQVEALTRSCDAVGMGLSLFVPTEPWVGGEVEKRDYMFRMGEGVATADDWFFLVDADEVVKARAWDRGELERTDLDVAEVTLWEQIGGLAPSSHPLRRMFRALPDLHVEQAHYIVTGEKDGERVYLSGPRGFNLEPPLPLRDIRLDHRNRHRNPLRTQKAETYYARRDEMEIERVDMEVQSA